MQWKELRKIRRTVDRSPRRGPIPAAQPRGSRESPCRRCLRGLRDSALQAPLPAPGTSERFGRRRRLGRLLIHRLRRPRCGWPWVWRRFVGDALAQPDDSVPEHGVVNGEAVLELLQELGLGLELEEVVVGVSAVRDLEGELAHAPADVRLQLSVAGADLLPDRVQDLGCAALPARRRRSGRAGRMQACWAREAADYS